MVYKKVKKIPEELSAIGIGCWNFGGDWDGVTDQSVKRVVCSAIEEGINFFDVAPVYGFHHAETVLGKVMKQEGLRSKIFLASKCGLRWGKDRITRNDLSRKSILEEIDASLERLQTDHIDLYQLHWPDHKTATEETADTLKEIQKAGKIRYVGLSNFSQQDVERFESYIEIHAQQGLYNMLERNTSQYHNIPLEYKTELEVFPHVKREGQAFLPYSPLCQGLLTGAFRRQGNFSQNDIRNQNPKFSADPQNDIYFEITESLKKFAGKIGKPLYEVAINWLRQKEEIATVIAGVKSAEELKKNLKSLTWTLDQEMLAEIDKIIAPVKLL